MCKAFCRVSSESRYGLHVYLLDATFLAIVQHSVEAISFICCCSADALIGINVNQFLVCAIFEQLLVVDILSSEGV